MKESRPQTVLTSHPWVLWWIAINVPFVLGHPSLWETQEPLVRSLAVSLVLFIAPGVAACGWRRWTVARVPLMLLLVILASSAVFLGLLLLFQVADWPIAAAPMWNATWAVSNLLAMLRAGAAWRASRNHEPRAVDSAASRVSQTWGDLGIQRGLVAAVLFAFAYGQYFHAAVRVVPPQADHDLEVQGTGFGLIHRMEPLLLTDRGPHYYFAHPLLLHFYVGGSFLYFGQIEQLRPYDEASQRVRTVREGGSIFPPSLRLGDYRLVGVVGRDYLLQAPDSQPVRLPVAEVETELIESYYAVQPGRLETRTPSFFLAALTVALMGWWTAGLSGRWWVGLLTAVAYATSPEVYVRSSYGGYFAISNFLVLCILIAAAERDARPKEGTAWWTCLLAGFLAGLANHKLVLLPASLALAGVLRSFRARDAWKTVIHATLIGFIAGTAVFWAHGFLIDAGAFWEEHVRTHLVDRAIHVNPLGYTGYPSVIRLWEEFCQHTGYVLLPLGLLAMLPALRPETESAANALAEETNPRLTPATLRSWAVWMAVTALVFSLVDWRMTKHLMPLLIPLHIAPAAWSRSRWTIRLFVVVVLGGLVIWNLAVLGTVMADFYALTITPAW